MLLSNLLFTAEIFIESAQGIYRRAFHGCGPGMTGGVKVLKHVF